MTITQDMYKPTRDNVVVLVRKLKKETESGITIPDSVLEARAKELGASMFVEVVAVGDEVKTIKVGDFILTPRAPMKLPEVVPNNPDYELGFTREYDIVGYYNFD